MPHVQEEWAVVWTSPIPPALKAQQQEKLCFAKPVGPHAQEEWAVVRKPPAPQALQSQLQGCKPLPQAPAEWIALFVFSPS